MNLPGTDLASFVVAARARAEASSRSCARTIAEGECFAKQWETLLDEALFQIWDCSRRAAKTATAIRRTVKRSFERPNWRTLYIHHTRTTGKQQFFETGDEKNPGVLEMLRSHLISIAHKDMTELNVRLANGSFIQVVGCDDARDIGKKLGYQWNDILIDECQEFDDAILERLVVKTIVPTLIDRRGTLTMMGTPAEIEAGVWYEYKTKLAGSRGYHHWTLFENPHIDPKNVRDVYEQLGHVIDFENPANNHVVVQREIFGLQVIDKSKLVYEYDEAKNSLPPDWKLDRNTGLWRFAMGVDVGGVTEENDEDAIVVLGWRIDDPAHHLDEVDAWHDRGDSEEFCNRVVETYQQWMPISFVGDTGGGGNKALATVQKRISGLMPTPKPTSVELSQRLVNDEFRSGRARVHRNGHVARAAKMCRKGKHEADVMAAYRYAHHGAYHYLSEAPPPPETDEDRRVRQWLERQAAIEDPYSPYRQ